MAKAYAKAFYDSQAWRKTRKLKLMQENYICERCGKVANIVHHKEYINPTNINNVDITLNMDNLEALCEDCHQKEHHLKPVTAKGLSFNSNGELVQT